MKIVILSIVLVMFVCTWASAESSVWKAQKGNSVIYLGGTIHVLRQADLPPPAEFGKAYQASSIVIFETDVAELRDPSTQQKLLAKAMYADGSTIDKHLSAPTYDKLSAYCAANGIPLDLFKQLQPSMLMTTLMFIELAKLGVTEQGIDAHYYEQAKKDGKVVRGLETVDEQIGFAVSMADGSEDEFVSYSIADMKDLRQEFATLATAWRAGDTGKLNELMVSELKDRWPKLYKKLISDRNSRWLPQIDALQKTPETELVLVGVGHLVGPDGIIHVLKKKGYRVDKL